MHQGAPGDGQRCFTTYVPEAVKNAEAGLQVPLVVDMHGGGGCGSQEAKMSGFKELADSLPAKDSFIIVWPQAHDLEWGSCGSDCDKVQEKAGNKQVASTDDLTFLSSAIAHVVKSTADTNAAKGRVDAERIFLTGFSMGCMISHRLALERSKFIAGFGCHGGTLIQRGDDTAAQKKRFDLQPMPAYMTGCTLDSWFNMAKPVFDTWATWNGCTGATVTTENMTLTASNSKQATKANLKVRRSCSDGTEVVLLIDGNEIIDGRHATDPRMAKYT
jgi:poly(3-hydroxybutyrate) depolymerase